MRSAIRTASVAVLLLGGAVVAAQRGAAQQPLSPAQPSVRQLALSKEERAALAPLQAAVAARDWAVAATALPAALAGARGTDARYIVARLQLQMALDTQNIALQSQAIDALVATGGVASVDLPPLLQNQAALAAGNGKYEKAEAIYTRLLELDPNNVEALRDLAKIKVDLRKPGEAVTLLDRAIAVREAVGQRAPESWYIFALRLAVDGKMTAQAGKLGRELATAYPTAENWRDVALAYFDLNRPGDPASLDVWRLMRAAGALAGERDFLQFAQAANSAGLAAEAKAVLDEGVARKMVDPAKTMFKELLAASSKKAAAERAGLGGRQTAAMAASAGAMALSAGDAFFGYGNYTTAATLYGAAIQKGGVDGAVANIRLGAALALAGRRPEAEATFRSVIGPGSDLAALWLAWLRQPA